MTAYAPTTAAAETGTLLAAAFGESAARAAVSIIKSKGLSPDLGDLSKALQALSMTAYDELVADLKAAEFMGEALQTEIFRAAAVSLAIGALKVTGALPA